MHCYSFVFFIVLFITAKSQVAKKLLCESSQTIYLPSDELFFLETSNYPAPLNYCSMKFILDDVRNFTVGI